MVDRPEARPRLQSVAGRGAGAWLTARPSFAGDRLSLSTADWQFAARSRLGLPAEQLQILGACRCGRVLSSYDTQHLVRCKFGRQLTATHEGVVRAVAGVLRDSSLATTVHTDFGRLRTYFTRVPEGLGVRERECIPDITFFQRGAHTEHALDVTVRQPLPDRGLQGPGGAGGPGGAAARGEREKDQRYHPWMALKGTGHFTPLAVETFGCLGERFEGFLRDCATATVAVRDGDRQEEGLVERVTQAYRQRVGVALQQSLAHAFRAVVAEGEGLLDSDLAADEEAVRQADYLALEVGGRPATSELAAVELDVDW